MPEAVVVEPRAEDAAADRELLAGMMLPAVAALANTIVGFMVAHWITITASKRTGYIVSVVDLLLCVAAGMLAMRAQRRLAGEDDTRPEHGRRVFMAKLDLALSAFAAVVVIAGTLVLVTLGPSD